MYGESDNLAVGYALGRDSNNNGYGNGAWGEWIWIIVLFALFGWGGNGFGGFGGNGGIATRNDLCESFNFNNLDNAVRGVQQGLCDGFYAMNTSLLTGFSNVQQSLCQGFNGTQREIANLGYNLQSCCCDLGRQIDGVKYANAQQTCDLITNQNANTQRILDFLCQEKISGLQAENATLTAQLSQNAQTNAIVNALSPKAPVPAYPVFAPNMSFAYPSGVSFGVAGRNDNCGCGCGC